MTADERPNVVLISPYRRAKQTAELIGSVGGIAEDSPELIIDERLREKEFGILDRLTRAGIERSHPQQAEFRRSTTGRRWRELVRRNLAATQRARHDEPALRRVAGR